MSKLIKVEWRAALFSADFKKAKDELTKELKKYDVVVTLDTLKDSKVMTTTLNKRATEIDTMRKESVYNVSLPIRAFENDMNQLRDMCKEGREKILKQVKVFEDETRAEVKKLLELYRQELFDDLKVDDEFRSAEFDDLVILSNLTGKGALTGKAKAALESRVTKDREKQMMVELRILKLENASYKAGLTTPLEKVHVKDFIYAPDDEYEIALNLLLEVEIKRQKATEEALRKKHDDEQKRNNEVKHEEVTQNKSEATPEVASEAETDNKKQEAYVPSPVKSGKIAWLISVDFEVSVGKDVQSESLEKRVIDLLAKSGIEVKEIKLNRGE